MASRSRLLTFLVIVLLPVVALLPGCRTGQRPFTLNIEPTKAPEQPPPGLVEIDEQCQANPETVVIEVGGDEARGSAAEALWHVPGIQAEDRIVISVKPAASQDPEDPSRGRSIQALFQSQYVIPPDFNAIRSGKPNKPLPVLEQGSVIWKYNIEYYREGQRLCTNDPGICVLKPGATGCEM